VPNPTAIIIAAIEPTTRLVIMTMIPPVGDARQLIANAKTVIVHSEEHIADPFEET
jgi:hypothetical protein